MAVTDRTQTPGPATEVPSATETARVIYIDFEGFENSAPSLVGVLVDDVFETVVLDPTLRPAADAKGLRTVDGPTLLGEVLDRARRENRRVCGFGTRELEASQDHFGVDLSGVWLNGHRVAKPWWRKTHPGDRPARRRTDRRRRGPRHRGGWSLEFFENRLGLERPRHLRSGLATSRLRAVVGQLERHRDFTSLTAVTKAKWTKLLAYNELDVRNLAAIVSSATSPPCHTPSRPYSSTTAAPTEEPCRRSPGSDISPAVKSSSSTMPPASPS